MRVSTKCNTVMARYRDNKLSKCNYLFTCETLQRTVVYKMPLKSRLLFPVKCYFVWLKKGSQIFVANYDMSDMLSLKIVQVEYFANVVYNKKNGK